MKRTLDYSHRERHDVCELIIECFQRMDMNFDISQKMMNRYFNCSSVTSLVDTVGFLVCHK